MKTKETLAHCVYEALKYIKTLADVKEAEVFASSNLQNVARFNFTSHILSNGVEEPKSKEDFGIGIQAVFATSEGLKTGFGSESNNLTLDGVKIALAKAREGAVLDAEFVSLPRPIAAQRTLFNYHDPELMNIQDEQFIDASWKILDGAVHECLNSPALAKLAARAKKSIHRLGLIVGGDLTVVNEAVAIASTALPEVKTDESAFATVSLTAMVEEFNAKGSSSVCYRSLRDISDEAGKEVSRNAIAACGIFTESDGGGRAGEDFREPATIESGSYPVIFGPQPLSEFITNLILPALTTSSFYGMESPFMGKFGEKICSPEISLYDDAANPAYVGAKGITCEGLPTQKTHLIINGVLTDLLSSWYETQRLAEKDPDARAKLGKDPKELLAEGKLLPASGFRFNRGGGRGYDGTPGISGTNVVLEGSNPQPVESIIEKIPFGVYIGRIWYCYPMNGLRAGDFTATVIADSFIIKDGKIFAPLKANAVRINDNIVRVLNAAEAVSDKKETALTWAADEVPVTCDMLVANVRLEEIRESEAGLPE